MQILAAGLVERSEGDHDNYDKSGEDEAKSEELLTSDEGMGAWVDRLADA